MGIPSPTAALLLPAAARIRFVPKPNFSGTVKLYYRAWDRTVGTVGSTLDTTGNVGGTKSLSAALANVSLRVTPTEAP